MTDPPPRILVLDDEAPIRRFLRIALEARGYAVVEAETARRGLEAAALDGQDLVILDLGLPDRGGNVALAAPPPSLPRRRARRCGGWRISKSTRACAK
jgi:two-component system, OmpR family, KDP operon response regulator KdpE